MPPRRAGRLTRLNDRLAAADTQTALISISKMALTRPCSKQQHRALLAGQQGGNAQRPPPAESHLGRGPDRCFNSSSSQRCSPRATGAIRSCHRHACWPGGRSCSASLLISARLSGGSLWHGSPCTWRPLPSGTARVQLPMSATRTSSIPRGAYLPGFLTDLLLSFLPVASSEGSQAAPKSSRLVVVMPGLLAFEQRARRCPRSRSARWVHSSADACL